MDVQKQSEISKLWKEVSDQYNLKMEKIQALMQEKHDSEITRLRNQIKIRKEKEIKLIKA